MNPRALFGLLSGGVAAGLAAALLDAGVKTGILLIVAATATVGLRKSSAATRHVVWTAAMACALVMPILSLWMPQWRVLPSWMGPVRVVKDVGALTALPPPLSARLKLQDQHTRQDQGETFTAKSDSWRPTSDSRTHAAAASSVQPVGPAFSLSTAVLVVWAVGAGLLLLPLLRSAWSLHRLSRRSQIFADGVLAGTLTEAAHELRLRRNVTIHAGGADAMPMVWGIWRAHLLLPSSAETWPASRLRAVMLHELAHIRRRDPLTLLLAQLARAIHWFNPLAWLAVHRLRVEQERACDDYVLRAGVKPSDYATDVLEIATVLRAAPATGAMALSMANPARLESRLRLIVHEACNRKALARWFVALASIAAVAIALPLAMVRAADDKPEAQAAGSAKVPTARSDAPGFRPVIERTVFLADSLKESFLDLDTGSVLSAPQEVIDALRAKGQLNSGTASDLREWMRASGADVRGGSEDVFHLDGLAPLIAESTNAEADEEKLKALSAKEVMGWLQGTQKAFSESSGPEHGLWRFKPQDIYAFKTREGAIGVLQVQHTPKIPRRVQLRYKVVQTTEPAKSIVAPVVTVSPTANQVLKPEVKLLTVERHTRSGVTMWQPDGSEVPDHLRAAVGRFDVTPLGENGRPKYVFAFLVKNPPEDSLMAYWSASFGNGAYSATLASMGKRPDLEGTLVRVATSFSEEKESTAARFGFAVKPWRTLLVWEGTPLKLTAQNWPGPEAPPEVALSSFRPEGIATATEGTRVEIPIAEKTRWQWDWNPYVANRDGKQQHANQWPRPARKDVLAWEFDDVQPAEVQSITLQGRSFEDDYYWTEFQNVALQQATSDQKGRTARAFKARATGNKSTRQTLANWRRCPRPWSSSCSALSWRNRMEPILAHCPWWAVKRKASSLAGLSIGRGSR